MSKIANRIYRLNKSTPSLFVRAIFGHSLLAGLTLFPLLAGSRNFEEREIGRTVRVVWIRNVEFRRHVDAALVLYFIFFFILFTQRLLWWSRACQEDRLTYNTLIHLSFIVFLLISHLLGCFWASISVWSAMKVKIFVAEVGHAGPIWCSCKACLKLRWHRFSLYNSLRPQVFKSVCWILFLQTPEHLRFRCFILFSVVTIQGTSMYTSCRHSVIYTGLSRG